MAELWAEPDWDALDRDKYADEGGCLAALLAQHGFDRSTRARWCAEAEALVRTVRAEHRRLGTLESFLQEFSLRTQEGMALMCLAEALLRTPDVASRDRLIAEKVAAADWAAHLGHSESLLVNASTWGLMLSGRLVRLEDEAAREFGSYWRRLVARLGEPLIRTAVASAMRILGEQFVLGRSIEEAVARAAAAGWHCSFDMLGEGARTPADAERYEALYIAAIEHLGRNADAEDSQQKHGVSVKLSALSPRFEATQEARVWRELYPRLRRLAVLAARHRLPLTIDAEETDRLILNLKLVGRLLREPDLAAWHGLGVVVQAYQKRAPAVIQQLQLLAEQSRRPLCVRLVKGAYWDSEIKRAQMAGRPDYPVFTRKAATDLSYLVCARMLLRAAPALVPQFATHNAHSLAAVHRLAVESGARVEYQRLHGMGEALYRVAQERLGSLPVRVYAPVGSQEELLPYLVRRLLENGANTSFVHGLSDPDVAASEIVRDPIRQVEGQPHRHPRLPPPPNLYGPERRNPVGLDLSIAADRARIERAVAALDANLTQAGPCVGGEWLRRGPPESICRPADRRQGVGQTWPTSPEDIEAAVQRARRAQPAWDQRRGAGRAQVLHAMAAALEARSDLLIALLAREAGKTLPDAIAEVREAVDFCRYYAMLAAQQFERPQILRGPVGERNELHWHGRGVFVCISPWNFPLAIFTGQIAAALAAGNAVLAKPAEQTPLIAAAAVQCFLEAGLHPDLIALLPGSGERVGAALVTHPGVNGVAFTGGTDTAWRINRSLAQRDGPILPFIAETGGMNALFVDTTALREQVIDDVLISAFGSAGQRCSALRVLFVPAATADEMIDSLVAALGTWTIGDPADPATDIGPVIDAAAVRALEAHADRLRQTARVRHQGRLDADRMHGNFFPPMLAEVPTADFLEREVFGPILHVYRYQPGEVEGVAAKLAARGYGLTLGVHSRLEGFINSIRRCVPAGNVYVNRSIIGAVVGVQPFGGEGLSGTGPKAGGPHALQRYAVERCVSINLMAQGGDPELLNL